MRILCMLVVAAAFTGSAGAQQKSPPVAPPPEQLEPAVDTTRSMPSEAAASPTAPVAPTRDSSAAASGQAAQNGAPAPKPAPPAKGPKGPDRVELETTDITGNRELPKVLYIVPWKRSDLGDLVGKPPNSLLDEVLQPIDRDVFLRENRYYDALKPDARAAGAGTVPGSGDKH